MEKINFVNNQAPALNSTNLNQLQTNIENAINGVVSSGSNDNGFWIKYDDGTMICRASKDGVTGNTVITFPVSFVSNKYQLLFAPGYASSPDVILSWGDKTANGFKFFTVIGGAYTDTTKQSFDYTAIGKWK